MIRIFEKNVVVLEDGESLLSAEIFCNSDDTKPTEGFANGSKLTEVDTGKTYLYDEDNEEWVEYSGGGGGTGGGVGIISTVEVNGQRFGLKCSNTNAYNFVIAWDSDDGMMYTPILYYTKRTMNMTIESGFNLVTYNEDGSTTPYVGDKRMMNIAQVAMTTSQAFDTPPIETLEYGLMIDVDTGAVIYQLVS